MQWMYGPGLPVWAEVLLAVGSVMMGCGVGYLRGVLTGKRRAWADYEEAFDALVQRRRHDLADRGRTTDRRPEHDGAQPARNARIVVRSRPAPRPDHPDDQRI